MGRVGTGLTAATLPLVIGLTFAQADCVIFAAIFFTLAGLVVVGTFAPYLWKLNELPGIGAPRLTASVTANGSPDLLVQISQRAKDEPELAPHSVLIRVAVGSQSRPDVEHAMLNFAFPLGHSLKACDHHGRLLDRGKLMPPTQEVPSFDYWAIDDLRFSGRNSYLFHFRVRVSHPGEYPMVVRIQSKDLYEELVLRKTLTVVEVQADSLALRDKLGRLIDVGEALQGDTDSSEPQLRNEASAFTFRAAQTVGDYADLVERLMNAELDYSGPQVGNDYLRALMAAKVRALYEIRDHLPVVGL